MKYMRAHMIIGLAGFLAGFSLMGESAFAGTINAILNGPSPTTFSSGSTLNFDLASSYFDSSSPAIDGGNTHGIIDQFQFDFGDGSSPTGWLSTPYASHTFVGAEGSIFAVTGSARWSGAPSISSTAEMFVTVSSNVAAIPEPEAYAMLIAGLGLLGAVARRRTREEASVA